MHLPSMTSHAKVVWKIWYLVGWCRANPGKSECQIQVLPLCFPNIPYFVMLEYALRHRSRHIPAAWVPQGRVQMVAQQQRGSPGGNWTDAPKTMGRKGPLCWFGVWGRWSRPWGLGSWAVGAVQWSHPGLRDGWWALCEEGGRGGDY